jgi:Phosphoesterase family
LKAHRDDPAPDAPPGEGHDPWWFMPTPQVAAVAVMAMLTAGVVIGSATSPVARSYSGAPIVIEELGGESGGEVEEGEEAETAGAQPSFSPEATTYAPLPEPPPAAPEAGAAPAAPPPLELPPDLEEEALPEIKHVFLIALDGHDYEEAFGPESQAPYLSEALVGEGKLLADYHPLAEGDLAERIAQLGERMSAARLSWREYVEPPLGEEEQPAGEGEEEDEARGDLDRLSADLKEGSTTPAFSYVVPNPCHDGAETPCAPEQPADLAAVDGFLEAVVPEITSSPAFEREGGLLAITFDRGPEPAPAPEEPAVAPEEPAPTPEEPPVGMLLISPYVAPGSVEETGRYDHLSFLTTVEELLGFEPPGDRAEPPPIGFAPTIFDASPEESTAAAPAQAQRRRSGMKR